MATPAQITDLNLPTVAFVGRVNVGKSTLFNKLTESQGALVSDIPGTTRTRNIGMATWRGKQFRLVDTGGLTFDSAVPLEDEIIRQTEIALSEADMIVFVTDIQDDLMPQEVELARRLRKLAGKKPVLLVANKADNQTWRNQQYDKCWLKLGLGAPLAVSAQNGAALGDLLDEIYKKLNKLRKRPKAEKPREIIKVALIGKPNVGKSSLFNKLIGEDRVIVSAMPHTTREPHDTLVELNGKNILFVDTAGIRRKTKVSGVLERAGIGKSLEAVRAADIVLLVLDATEPITDQDQQLAGLLRENTKSVIIVINKWDTAEGNDDEFRNQVKARIAQEFPHLDFAPIVLVSALTGYRTQQIFPLIERAADERKTEIAPEDLHEFIKSAVRKKLPGRGKGVRHPQILGMRQLHNNPPIFEILIKPKTSVHISYVHFLENRLREKHNFFACPIVIKLSKLKK